MPWTLNDAADQSGRLAMVTGANVGLGYYTALGLAQKGADVILACRDVKKASTAQAKIQAECPTANVSIMPVDVSKQNSVKQFARIFNAKYNKLDLLINNAGIMMPPFVETEDGFESQLATNYLGHFSLTGALLPTLNATPGARVISLASLAHAWGGINFQDLNFKQNYSARLAYGQSKLACLIFAYELDRRLKAAGATTLSVAAHPGVSATSLTRYMPKFIQPLAPLVAQSARAGADPTLYAALGEDVLGGHYTGPDGWRQMKGKAVKVGSSTASRDPHTAKKLWEMSETMTGTRFLSDL